MRIGFVSTPLAGRDGVSLQTTKIAGSCNRLGHAVFYCAGELDVKMTLMLAELPDRVPLV